MLKTFLSTPIPYFQTNREIWRYLISSGVYTFVFLTFFQPFGVNNYDPNETITLFFAALMFSMGVVVVLSLGVNEWGIRRLLPPILKRWQVWCWFGWTMLFLASVMFVYYNFLGNWHDLSWTSYVEFIVNIAALSFFPILINLLYLNYGRTKEKTTSGQFAGLPKPLLTFTSDNQKDRLAVSVEDLYYIEAQDNYCAIYYQAENTVKKYLIRASLKRLGQELSGTPVLRCHRSFLVNLMQVSTYKGNLHGLVLTVSPSLISVPVSRSFAQQIMDKLSQ
ncbi:MAG: LytTR family DNA-binding domain-containing protein [Bacteroidota bacterium]